MVDYTELRSVKQMAEEAPFLTEAKLRWWIFHQQKNGLTKALLKIDGRIYIDRIEFGKWLETYRLAANED